MARTTGTPRGHQFRLIVAIVPLQMTWLVTDAFSEPVSEAWQREVGDIAWVAYTPSQAEPDRGVQASRQSIETDIRVLRSLGFDGIVTYGTSDKYTLHVLWSAKFHEFRGVILGVWDPTNESEVEAAAQYDSEPLVKGFCVGNEGYRRRYSREELEAAMTRIRQRTHKPVTTSEEFDDYLSYEELPTLGDWVFPNAHPFFHGRQMPEPAVRWTVGAFEDLSRRTDRFVWFKEVGLPSGGDKDGKLSEANQAAYYKSLAKTPVRFTYFEAFDLRWKNWRPFESQWGLVSADGQLKAIARALKQSKPRTLGGPTIAQLAPTRSASHGKKGRAPFVIYHDGNADERRFTPSGLDGDCGDLRVDERNRTNPHDGHYCVRAEYTARGDGPNECDYGPPCRWAALRWQHPEGNSGRDPSLAGRGIDLSGYRKVTFWARSEKPCRCKFVVGGLDAPFGDSLAYPRSVFAKLGRNWQRVEIDLAGADLSHIISAFGWETNWESSPGGVIIYLDEIQFEE